MARKETTLTAALADAGMVKIEERYELHILVHRER